MAPELSAERAWIFRITHIENVPWILRHGLHCQSSDQVDPGYVSIGNPDLIAKRVSRSVPIHPHGTLADYIPFYFTPYSIMMYNIKTGYHGGIPRPNSEIAIMVASLRRLAKGGVSVVYTDRHAYLATAGFFSSMDDLDEIDWQVLQRRDFRRDPERPEKTDRYQAEALIHEYLPVDRLAGIVCYTEKGVQTLEREVREAQIELRIANLPDWYF